ncbi:hypothetical protein FRB96_001642 [Tulasnella sp. 330]|nr:hypothetical protein FRB96_001642 [Tulasnella sp. 330]
MPITSYKKFNLGKPRPDRTFSIPDSSSDGKDDTVIPQGELHSVVQRDELVHMKWRGWIGTFIADNLDWPLDRPWHIADFPKGYTLVQTIRKSAEDRVDYHLYGYGKKTAFDSPREFAFHAVWLFWRPYHDEHSCECTLCTGRKQGYINSIWIGVPGIVRRDRDEDEPTIGTNRSGGGSGGRRLVKLPTRSGFVSWINLKRSLIRGPVKVIPPVIPDMALDLSFARYYRVGELVWVLVDHLRPSASNTADPDEVIKFWPAIVQKPLARGRQIGTAPSSPQNRTMYTVQLLGVENRHEVPFEHILSWYAYALPETILQQIQDPLMPVEITRALTQLADFHPLPIPPPAPAPARPGYRTLPVRPEIPRTFENALGPLSMAHRKAEFIQMRYCSTDEYSDFDPERGELKSYQGLWWGAERIWIGDIVRLTCTRADLEQEHLTDRLLAPSRDAPGRPLLARMKEIVFDEAKGQLCFSAEVYELKRTSKTRQDSVADHDGLLGLRPPHNLRFRTVTPSDVLIYLPVQTIAGRYDSLPLDSEPHRNLLSSLVTDENLTRLGRGELDGTELGTSLKDVMALSGLCMEEGDRIYPELYVSALRGRESILVKATEETKKITYENWVKYKERLNKRQLDGDGDSVMSD